FSVGRCRPHPIPSRLRPGSRRREPGSVLPDCNRDGDHDAEGAPDAGTIPPMNRSVRVELHRIEAGGSVRSVVNGGAPTYFTETELRENLRGVPISPEDVEKILSDLSAGRGEHRLSFDNASPVFAESLILNFTGAERPVEK